MSEKVLYECDGCRYAFEVPALVDAVLIDCPNCGPETPASAT